MKRIAIYGAGGFGKEVRMLLDRISQTTPDISFAGYLDDFAPRQPVANEYDDVAVAIADVKVRQIIYERLRQKGFPFQSLLHPGVLIDKTNHIGDGCILCAGVQLTVDIRLGRCVIVNLSTTIGHDVTIGDFTSIMPSANISGGVTIGKNVFIGSGAMIFQGITLGDNAIVGAGAVVRHSVSAGQKVAGVPARPI